MGLTKKHKLFCEYYISEGCIATSAYQKAYRKASPESAKAASSRLMENPEIKAYIQEIQDKLVKKIEISRDQVLSELAAIGFANITDFVAFTQKNIKLNDSSKISPEKLKAVAEIVKLSGKHGDTVRLKLHSKLEALNMLAKMLGLYAPEKVDLGLNFEKLTDDQLDLIIEKLTEKVK